MRTITSSLKLMIRLVSYYVAMIHHLSQHNSEKRQKGLLLDLQIAAPRTSNFYAVSSTQVAVGDANVYAIAQCNQKVSQSVCLECLKLRSISLYDWLPGTSGRAMDNGCFMRYSRTPFLDKTRPLILHLSFGTIKIAHSGQQDKSTGSTELLQVPATFSYNELKAATNNLSNENRLGGGLFGEVYKGTLKDGDAVAIKKTFMASSRGKTHFHDELKIISNVHHRHLVRVLGYCP